MLFQEGILRLEGISTSPKDLKTEFRLAQVPTDIDKVTWART